MRELPSLWQTQRIELYTSTSGVEPERIRCPAIDVATFMGIGGNDPERGVYRDKEIDMNQRNVVRVAMVFFASLLGGFIDRLEEGTAG